MSDWVIFQRLFISALLAGFIGYERERHGRAAGFRTHILVSVGSCLMMMTGIYVMEAMPEVEVDPTRMGAQVISGIGFLGAGTILQFRASVRGLTTAACLWAAAGIGLAVGAGFQIGAVAATVAVLGVLFGIGQIERRMRKDWYQTLTVEMSASPEEFARIRQVLGQYEVEIRDLDIRPADQPGRSLVAFDVKLGSVYERDPIIQAVERVEGVQRAYWT